MQKLENFLVKHPIILQILRFGAIGAINTALDFAVLNFLSVRFQILAGLELGSINVIGFSLAVIQSYFWNKYWAFNEQGVSLLRNVIRLCMVGLLGALVMVMVLYGRIQNLGSEYFIAAIALMIIGQLAIWFSQGFKLSNRPDGQVFLFTSFLGVSLVGLLINSGVVAGLSDYLLHIGWLTNNKALASNIAKLVATLASLIWNFIGYKLIVFRR